LQGLQRTWAKNSRCLWWENCSSFSGFRSSKQKREPLCIKPSTRRISSWSSRWRLEAPIDIDEYDYSTWHGRGQRARGPEGVPKHDLPPLYLTATRLDIQFSMCLCARFQASLRASHGLAIKRIFRCDRTAKNNSVLLPKTVHVAIKQ
jgi:hypothetical protein